MVRSSEVSSVSYCESLDFKDQRRRPSLTNFFLCKDCCNQDLNKQITFGVEIMIEIRDYSLPSVFIWLQRAELRFFTKRFFAVSLK